MIVSNNFDFNYTEISDSFDVNQKIKSEKENLTKSLESKKPKKLSDLSHLEQIMLLMEVTLETHRRTEKGITKPYYKDKQFTDHIKTAYGIDIAGSGISTIIEGK